MRPRIMTLKGAILKNVIGIYGDSDRQGNYFSSWNRRIASAPRTKSILPHNENLHSQALAKQYLSFTYA